jgi:hypothetical protein
MGLHAAARHDNLPPVCRVGDRALDLVRKHTSCGGNNHAVQGLAL